MNQVVWLNNIAFNTVHPALVLQHINEGELEYRQTIVNRPGFGQLVVANDPLQRTVTIEFGIRERTNYAVRVAALQALYKWASEGGTLQLSSHPGQELYVTCKKLPALGRLREWNETMQIEFCANEFPFWINSVPKIITLESELTAGTDFTIGGTAPAFMEADITFAKEDSSTHYITMHSYGYEAVPRVGNAMTIGSLSNFDFELHYNETLSIYYDNHHRLHAVKKSGYQETNCLPYRSGGDHIMFEPGAMNDVGFQAAHCNITVKVREVWL